MVSIYKKIIFTKEQTSLRSLSSTEMIEALNTMFDISDSLMDVKRVKHIKKTIPLSEQKNPLLVYNEKLTLQLLQWSTPYIREKNRSEYICHKIRELDTMKDISDKMLRFTLKILPDFSIHTIYRHCKRMHNDKQKQTMYTIEILEEIMKDPEKSKYIEEKIRQRINYIINMKHKNTDTKLIRSNYHTNEIEFFKSINEVLKNTEPFKEYIHAYEINNIFDFIALREVIRINSIKEKISTINKDNYEDSDIHALCIFFKNYFETAYYIQEDNKVIDKVDFKTLEVIINNYLNNDKKLLTTEKLKLIQTVINNFNNLLYGSKKIKEELITIEGIIEYEYGNNGEINISTISREEFTQRKNKYNKNRQQEIIEIKTQKQQYSEETQLQLFDKKNNRTKDRNKIIDTKIDNIETTVSSHEKRITSLEQTVNKLIKRIDKIDNGIVLMKEKFERYITEEKQGYATLIDRRQFFFNILKKQICIENKEDRKDREIVIRALVLCDTVVTFIEDDTNKAITEICIEKYSEYVDKNRLPSSYRFYKKIFNTFTKEERLLQIDDEVMNLTYKKFLDLINYFLE
ncbi:hypothetical protein ACFL56_01415 [Candidatus Margulisiibacteriota bacterium]